MSGLVLGAVAYDPKVVTIWDGFRAWFRGPGGLDFDYVLYSNYERQVEDLVAGRVEELETTAANNVVLEHPQHLIADLAVVRVVGVGGQRNRHHVQARVGLVGGGGEQAIARLLCVGRFGHATEPRDVRAASQRCQHADQTAEEADARLQERERGAQQERQRAGEAANARRRQAESRAQTKKQQAAKAETGRREAAREAAAQREQAIEKRAPREELKTLEAKSDALRAREQELAARDEARRLADAASKIKAQRKAD